jgi:hypothetical protein
MVAEPGDPGFVDGRTSLVPHNGVRLPATITAKKPPAGGTRNMANWLVHNASPHGVLANADFYKYLEHAEGADLRGTALWRKFTIEEVRKGWWKQGKVTLRTKTVLPDHLRFRLPENSQLEGA